MKKLQEFSLLLSFLPAVCFGDQEASNVPRISADSYGRCYAKSVPAESYGQSGTTRVYSVQSGEDKLLHTFDWYAGQLYVACNVSAPGKAVAVSLVRFGPWHRGDLANQEDLAIAIYWDGQLAASYSTLDIAGTPTNASASVSHYSVVKRVVGFEHIEKSRDWNEYQFAVETTDGRVIAFHAATGEKLSVSQ